MGVLVGECDHAHTGVILPRANVKHRHDVFDKRDHVVIKVRSPYARRRVDDEDDVGRFSSTVEVC